MKLITAIIKPFKLDEVRLSTCASATATSLLTIGKKLISYSAPR